jgi:uncharacterized protein YbjT (DUF2867 family)
MNLVIGASGKLGNRIAKRLLEDGQPVTAVSRTPEKLSSLRSEGATVIRGDLRDPSWMEQALHNVRYLFIAAHGLVPPSRSNTIDTVDDVGNRRLIDAAKRAGVERIIFTSVHFAQPDAPMKFGRIKYRVEEHLKASGVNYTVVRPSAFIETHAIDRIAVPIKQKGKVVLLGNPQIPMLWISVEDAANYMVDSAIDSGAKNSVKVISGPDTMSQMQVIELIERLLGKKAKRSRIPTWFLQTVRIISKPLHPGVSNLLEAALAETGSARHDEKTSAHLDWVGPTRVEDVAKRWMNDLEKSIA